MTFGEIMMRLHSEGCLCLVQTGRLGIDFCEKERAAETVQKVIYDRENFSITAVFRIDDSS